MGQVVSPRPPIKACWSPSPSERDLIWRWGSQTEMSELGRALTQGERVLPEGDSVTDVDGHRGRPSEGRGRGWNDTATAEDAGELRPSDGEAVTQGCRPGLRTVGGRVAPAPASRGPSLRQLWESRTGVWGLRLSDGLLWGSTWLFSLFLTR